MFENYPDIIQALIAEAETDKGTFYKFMKGAVKGPSENISPETEHK
jgi:hypothetical protein